SRRPRRCGPWNSTLASGGPGEAGVDGALPEGLLDAQQLVVLGHPVGAGRRPRLDLTAAPGNGEGSDEGILRSAAAVRDDAGVAGPGRHAHGVERLGQRADLVEL